MQGGGGYSRRDLLVTAGGTGVAALLPRAPALASAGSFGFAEVAARAQELAGQEFAAPSDSVPERLRDLDASGYDQIGFRAAASLWRDEPLPFRIALSHVGWRHLRPAQLHIIDGEHVSRVDYNADMFSFGTSDVGNDFGPEMGFAGFQIHYSAGDPSHFPEIGRFEADGRFHLLGREQRHGAAGRAVAINTASASGEELPSFREFWIEKPAINAAALRIYGLLDSPSLTGAFEFVLRPGVLGIGEVRGRLILRREVAKLGIAPLTSMFLFGEPGGRRFDDVRLEVHDSDGLSINNGRSEWLWRPLANPRSLQVSAFLDERPGGYGLLQRDRAYANYQDLDARFDHRPSLWVEPAGDWGRGWVELVEIPSEREVHDNIITYWVREQPARPDAPVDFAYRLYAGVDEPRRPPLARVDGTFFGRGFAPDSRRVVIDFVGEPLTTLAAHAPVEARVTTSAGRIGPVTVAYHSETAGRRVAFDLLPEGAELCELDCALQRRERQLSEGWVYRWTAN